MTMIYNAVTGKYEDDGATPSGAIADATKPPTKESYLAGLNSQVTSAYPDLYSGDMDMIVAAQQPQGVTRDRSAVLADYNAMKPLSPEEAAAMTKLQSYYKEGQFDPGSKDANVDVWGQADRQWAHDNAPNWFEKYAPAIALGGIGLATGGFGLSGLLGAGESAGALAAADASAGLIPAGDLAAMTAPSAFTTAAGGITDAALAATPSTTGSSYFSNLVDKFNPAAFGKDVAIRSVGNLGIQGITGQDLNLGRAVTGGVSGAVGNYVIPDLGLGNTANAAAKGAFTSGLTSGFDPKAMLQGGIVGAGSSLVNDATKDVQKTIGNKFDELTGNTSNTITGGGTDKTQQGAIKDANDFWKINDRDSSDAFAPREVINGDVVNVDENGFTVDSKGYARDFNGDVKGFYYPDGAFQPVTYDANGNITSGRLGGVSTDDSGVVTYPDGTVVNPDGTSFQSMSNDVRGVSTDDTGVRVLPDGTVVNPDGKVVNPKDEKKPGTSSTFKQFSFNTPAQQGKKREFGDIPIPELIRMGFDPALIALMQKQ